MRVHPWLPLVFTSLVAVSAIPVFAQFQEPTKEELQMTTDPKAPGAAAIYLYREQVTNDAMHFESYHVRIKVLTEKGKELATVRIPYPHHQFKVTDIHGRTIHSDGRIIPLTSSPEDLMDFKSQNYQLNTMVFTLPDVDVGSILEYSLLLRFDDSVVVPPTWEIQQPYYVRKAHYFFKNDTLGGSTYITNSRGDNLNRLLYAYRLDPNGTAKVVDSRNGTFALDLTDIPPLPDDDWMPPINAIKWQVKFYFTQYASGPEFWQKEGKRWGKEVEHFIQPTDALRKAVAQIVGPADTDEQKAHKIYNAVMQLENTAFTRSKSEAERKKEKIKDIRSAEDVWTQKGGSDDNLALLFVAMARIAGLQAFPMQVVDRNRAIFDPDYLSLDQLDDYIAVLSIAGKEVFVDPGQKDCPYGLLHWKHTMALGLRLSPTGVEPAITPAGSYRQTQVSRFADLNIQDDGSLKGSIRFVFTGQDALHWRQLAIRNDPDELKKQFREAMQDSLPDGVQAEFNHFTGLEDDDAELVGIVDISGAIGTATGKRFFMPGLFFESRTRHPFGAQSQRTIPVDVHYPKLEQDQVTYHLPAGYSVESLPQATDVEWPAHAMMKIKSSTSGESLTVARLLAYSYTILQPKDYSDLHNFYQKAGAADQQQLVLTHAVVAKGN